MCTFLFGAFSCDLTQVDSSLPVFATVQVALATAEASLKF